MVALPAQDPSPNQSQSLIEKFLNGPAAPPPSGVTPLEKDPPTLEPVAVAVVTVCHTFAALAIFCRMYTKVFLIRSMAWEDYTILVAWVGLIGFTVPSMYNFESGGGVHMWDIKLIAFYDLLYWLNVAVIIYGIVVFLIKLSILLQYMRIFVPTRKANMGLFVAIQAIIWISFVFYFTETIIWIAQCNPRDKIWHPLKPGHCLDPRELFMISGVYNVISDFAILVVPIAPIFKLQMPLKRKLIMLAVFATGFFACVVSIIRTISTWKATETTDSSYYIVVTGLWTWAELTTGILISCFPVMPKFFVHFSPKARSLFSRLSGSSHEQKSKPRYTGDNSPRYNDSGFRQMRDEDRDSPERGRRPTRDRYSTKDIHIILEEFETSSSTTAATPKRLSHVSHEEGRSAV